MENLLFKLKDNFDKYERIYSTFTKYEFQTEGWFKAELITILDEMKNKNIIVDFDREIRLNNNLIDILINTKNGNANYVELKHCLIGNQKGEKWTFKKHITDNPIMKDIEKLNKYEIIKNPWLFLLLTENPGKEDWDAGISNYNSKIPERKIEAFSNPDDFPQSYFLGLLKIHKSNL